MSLHFWALHLDHPPHLWACSIAPPAAGGRDLPPLSCLLCDERQTGKEFPPPDPIHFSVGGMERFHSPPPFLLPHLHFSPAFTQKPCDSWTVSAVNREGLFQCRGQRISYTCWCVLLHWSDSGWAHVNNTGFTQAPLTFWATYFTTVLIFMYRLIRHMVDCVCARVPVRAAKSHKMREHT